jgi:hemoglobin
MTDSGPPFDTVTEPAIKQLIDAFYAKVRRHPQLGPIFAAAITDQAWPVHMQTMYGFWSSVMLTSGRYKGNPVAVHAALPGLSPSLFGTWLELFEATARAFFTPTLATAFVSKAERIAHSLKLAIFHRHAAPFTEDELRHPLPHSAVT